MKSLNATNINSEIKKSVSILNNADYKTILKM